MRIAALSDLHYTKHSKAAQQALFDRVSSAADMAVLCGDLTDYGLPEEARLLADDLESHLKLPTLAVLGNHDFESGHAAEVDKILEEAGVTVLDGDSVEIGGIGIAGVCGFGGGFGPRLLNAWGEPIIKSFVQEAVDHALRLEKALARLEHLEKKIALLHYSPIRETVVGECEEIFPFLGSSRLEGPLNRYAVQAAFHGHAHNGTPRGTTSQGIPVFNVALPLMSKTQPERPFLVYEL